MNLPQALSVTIALVFGTGAFSLELPDARGYLEKVFPPAEAGMTRHAIILPPKKNEADLKVELFVGQMVGVSSANLAGFDGKIEAVEVKGWGFERYVVKSLGNLGTTLAAGGVPESRFVTMGPIFIRYNSRVPIAIYVPANAEVRYRIWSAVPEMTPAPKQ